MNSFKSCFRKKLPYSLLIVPCIPCAGDSDSLYLILSTVACLVVFFLTKFIYRNDPAMVGHLNDNEWVPLYFVIGYALAITIVIAALIIKRNYLKRRQFRFKKWFSIMISSMGIGILPILSSETPVLCTPSVALSTFLMP